MVYEGEAMYMVTYFRYGQKSILQLVKIINHATRVNIN